MYRRLQQIMLIVDFTIVLGLLVNFGSVLTRQQSMVDIQCHFSTSKNSGPFKNQMVREIA